MTTLIFIAIALLVGWATPQPAFAKTLTDWVVGKYQALVNKVKQS